MCILQGAKKNKSKRKGQLERKSGGQCDGGGGGGGVEERPFQMP